MLKSFHRAFRRILRAKMYFCTLPWTNQKQENSEASKSEVKTIQLFAPFSCWLAAHFHNVKMTGKPNGKANSQSSQLDKEELQKLEGEDRR